MTKIPINKLSVYLVKEEYSSPEDILVENGVRP